MNSGATIANDTSTPSVSPWKRSESGSETATDAVATAR
jgi:hypothetical protein